MSQEGRPRAGLVRDTFAMGIVAVLAIGGFSFAQTVAPTNTAPNPYRAIENWGKLPDGRTWGSTSAIDIDPDGTSVWVGERCGAFAPPSQMKPGMPFACDGSKLDPILKFDAAGNLLKSFGAGMFIFPHGMHVDRAGNVWLTDGLGREGKGHQVFKFSPDGKLLLTLASPAWPAADRTSSMRRRRSTSRRTATSSWPTVMAATPTRGS